MNVPRPTVYKTDRLVEVVRQRALRHVAGRRRMGRHTDRKRNEHHDDGSLRSMSYSGGHHCVVFYHCARGPTPARSRSGTTLCVATLRPLARAAGARSQPARRVVIRIDCSQIDHHSVVLDPCDDRHFVVAELLFNLSAA